MFKTENNLIIFTPDLHSDDRGFFYESYNEKLFHENGIRQVFLQDNVSFSTRGVLRGLHYQEGMSKLVRCTQGVIFDVAVNLETGKYFAIILSGDNKKQLFIPSGYAHGFLCLSETAEVSYKCSKLWDKEKEGGIRYDSVGIRWLLDDLILSEKDKKLPAYEDLVKEEFKDDGWYPKKSVLIAAGLNEEANARMYMDKEIWRQKIDKLM